MKIALTHPWCWPLVQRGGERLLDDLARYLAGGGHDVVTISAGAVRSDEYVDGVRNLRLRSRAPALLRPLDIDQAVTYLPGAARALRAMDPDVVHGLYHLDGLAARLARRRPYVVHLQGMPVRRSLIGRPVQRRLFRASVSGAAALITVSRAAADALRVEFGLPARPLLNGVDTAMFASGSAGVARTDTPSVLFPGDPADVRKRLDLLVQAVAALRQAGDDVTLLIAAPVRNPDIRRRVVEQLDGAVEFLDIATPDAMPAAYGRAWITCAPAVREAFGLVIVESLATGTPVVAVRDGGVTEVLREPSWLAEPDDAVSLATAIRQALTAAGDAGSPAHCRALAAPFDWSVRGPAFEELYADVVTTP